MSVTGSLGRISLRTGIVGGCCPSPVCINQPPGPGHPGMPSPKPLVRRIGRHHNAANRHSCYGRPSPPPIADPFPGASRPIPAHPAGALSREGGPMGRGRHVEAQGGAILTPAAPLVWEGDPVLVEQKRWRSAGTWWAPACGIFRVRGQGSTDFLGGSSAGRRKDAFRWFKGGLSCSFKLLAVRALGL